MENQARSIFRNPRFRVNLSRSSRIQCQLSYVFENRSMCSLFLTPTGTSVLFARLDELCHRPPSDDVLSRLSDRARAPCESTRAGTDRRTVFFPIIYSRISTTILLSHSGIETCDLQFIPERFKVECKFSLHSASSFCARIAPA